ncbi:MAG: type II toxin-antitoxin system HicB family antitoxin [Nitrospinota bacterium]
MSQQMIGLKVKLPVHTKKKSKWYIAICEPLDVVAQGDTEKKALKNLKETLTLFLISCIERNTLDAVLAECGFEKVEISPSKRKSGKATPMHHLNIPLNLLSSHSCHA